MLETIVEKQILVYVMGIIAGIGIFSKLISQVTLRRLVRAASKMSKSNHKLMRLVKAKFEHASMVSGQVPNVDVFLKKYLYEYKVLGLRLHTWRNAEKKSVWIFGIFGAVLTGASYFLYGMNHKTVVYLISSLIGTAILCFLYVSSNEVQLLEMLKNYMMDFLENVSAHRYEKAYQQKKARQAEIVQVEEMAQEEHGYEYASEQEQGSVEDAIENAFEKEVMAAVSEEKTVSDAKEKGKKEEFSQEVRIREILKEFLA